MSKPSLIILEGPDGSGKTTLANKLIDEGYHYVHNGPPTPGGNVFQGYTEQLRAARGRTRPTVIDRFHLGEMIYGSIIRKAPQFEHEGIELLDRLIHAAGGVTIVCLPPMEVCFENWKARKGAEYIQQADLFGYVYDAYREMSRDYYRVWDYTRGINAWPEFRHALPKGVTGNPNASVLIVGEQINPLKTNGEDLPFHDLAGSSRFLTKCLHLAGFKESDLAFTNALKVGGQEERNISKVLYSMYFGTRTGIIALGTSAKKIVFDQIPTHTDIFFAPHPQHVKRFGGPEGEANYIKRLKEIYDATIATSGK